MDIDTELTSWLLSGPAWAAYRTRLDLLGQSPDHAEVRAAREAMLADAQVQALAAEVADWPWPVLKRHNDAAHPLHKLAFLAGLGVTAADLGLADVVGRMLETAAPEGAFRVPTRIDPHFGGTGEPALLWMACDAPLQIEALARLGLGEEARVVQAAAHLAALAQDMGWPCVVSPGLKFHGPGRRTDPCPYATLLAVRALSELPAWRESPTVRTGAEALLGLWQTRREHKPYLFGMGTDFAKLKAPLIWYDLLPVLDTLTRFPWLRGDPRLLEMAAVLRAQADAAGRYTATSVWKAWGAWEFGQKKAPSRWVTLVAVRALGRMG